MTEVRDGGPQGPASAASARPRWMTACAVFCGLTIAFLVPRDLFFPETRDVEVWLGFEVHGRAAQLSAPLHWAIFAIGAWGFWTQRPWILPAAAAYAFYVALSHLVWSEVSPHGHGWPAGLLQAALLSIPGVLLLRAHAQRRARSPRVPLTGRTGTGPGRSSPPR